AAGCELLLHAAGAVDLGRDGERLRRVNVGGTANAVAAARPAGGRRLVHVSTIAAVGASTTPTPLDETPAWNLGGRRVAHVESKRRAEESALAANGGGLEVVVANPACVIGPGDSGGSEFGRLCQRFWRGRAPVHFGGGANFVDVRDVADGLLRAGELGRPGQ